MPIDKTLVKFFTVSLVLICPVVTALAQGQFAGTMKPMVGSTFKDSKMIPALNGFEFQEGSLISDMNDPESVVVDVFKKGSTSVVFFSVMADSATHAYQVMDAIEIKQIQPGWEVKTTFCREFGIGNIEIVALVQANTQTYLKNVKQAWRFKRDTKKFLPVNPKQVDCLKEG